MDGKFATAINCIDGRAQEPVIEYIKKVFGADYVDMITEPGPNKILSEQEDTAIIGSLKKRVKISVEKHGSKIIIIAAHQDCAGNPADEKAQKEHLRKAVDTIFSWNFPVKKVIALWLDENFKPGVVA